MSGDDRDVLANMRALASRLQEAENAMRKAIAECHYSLLPFVDRDPLLDYLHKYDLMDVPE